MDSSMAQVEPPLVPATVITGQLKRFVSLGHGAHPLRHLNAFECSCSQWASQSDNVLTGVSYSSGLSPTLLAYLP